MSAAERELDRLCQAGIPFSVAPLDDGYLKVRLGDYVRGLDIAVSVTTLSEAVAWLRVQAKARYPESTYAKALSTN